MAYLTDIPRPNCKNWISCRRRATTILHNNVNAPLGEYCGPCGDRAQREQNERERAALANARRVMEETQR